MKSKSREIPGAPGWLSEAMRALPLAVCTGEKDKGLSACRGAAILLRDADRNGTSRVCKCSSPVVRSPYLDAPVLTSDDPLPTVTWLPQVPKAVQIKADGKGDVVFSLRSKTTFRYIEQYRAVAWRGP